MSYARIISTIKRNGDARTVVRAIKGKLTCNKVKPNEDIKRTGEIVGVYTDSVPAAWVVDDLNSLGFVE